MAIGRRAYLQQKWDVARAEYCEPRSSNSANRWIYSFVVEELRPPAIAYACRNAYMVRFLYGGYWGDYLLAV